MAQITKEQIKRVYALASGLGILESGNKNDLLHELVFSVTNKESVSQLTDKEFNMVQHELIERMKLSNQTAPLKKKKKPPVETQPDMMTSAQQNLAWRLVYRLQELDTSPSEASVGERMVGAINKILGITANVVAPFHWVSFTQATTLIETLKRYVRSAEHKSKAKAGVG